MARHVPAPLENPEPVAPGPEVVRAGREARGWVNSRDTSWPFAFERICEAFEIDAEHVRRQLDPKKPVRMPVLPPELTELSETGS